MIHQTKLLLYSNIYWKEVFFCSGGVYIRKGYFFKYLYCEQGPTFPMKETYSYTI